jgi:hypothetical protein
VFFILTSKQHSNIPAAKCGITSWAPTPASAEDTSADSADNFNRAASNWRPYLCRDEKASKDLNTAADDGPLFDRATRIRTSRKQEESSLTVVREVEAIDSTKHIKSRKQSLAILVYLQYCSRLLSLSDLNGLHDIAVGIMGCVGAGDN